MVIENKIIYKFFEIKLAFGFKFSYWTGEKGSEKSSRLISEGRLFVFSTFHSILGSIQPDSPKERGALS
jgi:hypothetical protein